MKKILFPVLILIAIICFQSSIFAQKVDPKNYDKFIEEVYGGTEYVAKVHVDFYHKLLNAVEVKKWDGQDYPALETIDLVNKYNPSLKYDIGKDFTANKFNPLKYFFLTNVKQVYRVTNTNYMIVVEPIER